ncbi:MAG: sugar transferase [Bacteroidales bacterium]|nr:sugar transferase [Bacteroidales bacterium]MDY5780874.1 sugar transferase [Candidatus Cryptobacteroides sp.]
MTIKLLAKRLTDIVVSGLGMIILSPVFLVAAIAIRIESPGGSIFSQERIGYKGKPFTLYKFRSMVRNAENNGVPALCAEEDARLTRVGAFLRNHHLDELPQLWNVFTGDMSMVGYRPEREYFIERIKEHNPDYSRLFAMRPGVFSYATLYNGYTATMDKMLVRLKMDLEYLDNWTLWMDIKIIFLTAVAILTGKRF